MCEINPLATDNIQSIKDDKRFDFNWTEEIENEVYKLNLIGESDPLGLMACIDVSHELRIEIRLLESAKENIGKKKKYENVVGCLIAYACRESFKRGYHGFVSLIPKTDLVQHYKEEYGMSEYGVHLAVDFADSQALISKYLEGN